MDLLITQSTLLHPLSPAFPVFISLGWFSFWAARQDQVQQAACWAHARRKFVEIHKAQASPLAAEAIRRIGALYDIERDIRGRSPDARASERKHKAEPLLADLHRWLLHQLKSLAKKSESAKAIQYALTL